MASKDIQSEDMQSLDASAVRSSQDENVKELQESFQHQQAMIDQLRDMLKKKDESIKQDEMEDYAIRLAKMKPKLLKGKGRGRLRERAEGSQPSSAVLEVPKESLQVEAIPPIATSQAVSTEYGLSLSHSPIPSQEREKCASPTTSSQPSAVQSQESGSRSKILLLRKQLDENRLKFERQKREENENKAVLDNMKSRIEKLRSEVEHRDALIQSLQQMDSVQATEQNMQHLYQQIIYKDNNLLELTDKINCLETAIQDQREQLQEKDKIIAARTEAVALVTKDRDDKMKSTMQDVEELKLAMREMQASFMTKEEAWLQREKAFSMSIEERNRKEAVLEENTNRMESVRFELCARNANMQDRVISLQSECKELHSELSSTKSLLEVQTENMKEVNKKLVRAEAFGQKKLKALEKQVHTISGDGDLGNNILELQNKITELEEEKGNLQLKLVDFDDLKSQIETLTSTVTSLKGKLDQVNSELLSQLIDISELGKEKMKLVEEINLKNIAYNTLERKFAEWNELKQSNVTLELRLCSLEEERDIAIREKKDMENECRKLGVLPTEEINSKVLRLEEMIKVFQKEIRLKDEIVQQNEELMKENEVKTQLAIEECEAKTSENECLISMIAEKEMVLLTQSDELSKLRSFTEQIECEKSVQVSELESKIVALNEKCCCLENTIQSLQRTQAVLENEALYSKDEINKLKTIEKDLSSVVDDREKMVAKLEKEIYFFNTELRNRESAFSKQTENLDYLESQLKTAEMKYENRSGEYYKLEQDIFNMKKCFQETEDKLTCIIVDKDNQIKLLDQEINVKKNELKNNLEVITMVETELHEKNLSFNNLDINNKSLQSKVTSLDLQIVDLSSNLENKISEIHDLQESLNKKEIDIAHLQLDNEKMKIIENENSDLRTLLQEKENNLQRFLADKEETNAFIQQTIAEKEETNSYIRYLEAARNEANDNSQKLLAERDEAFANIENLKAEIYQTFSNSEILKVERDESDLYIKQLEVARDAANESSQKLLAERDEAFANSEKLKVERDEAFSNSEKMKAERDESDLYIKQLEAARDAANESSQKLLAERDEAFANSEKLKVERDEAFSNSEKMKAERDEAFANSEKLKAERDEANSSIRILEATSDESNYNLQKILAERDEINSYIKLLEAMRDEAYTTIEKLKAERDDANSYIQQLVAERDESNIQQYVHQLIAEKNEEIIKLQNAMKTDSLQVMEAVEKWEKELRKKDEEIATLKHLIKDEEVNKLELQEEVVSQSSQSDSKLLLKIDNLKHQLDEAVSYRAYLEELVERLQNDIQSKVENMSAIQKEEDLSNRAILLESQLHDSLCKIDQLTEEFETKLDEESEKYTYLLEETNGLRNLLNEKRQEVALLRAACDELTLKMERESEDAVLDLRCQLQDAAQLGVELKKKVSKYEEELTLYKEKMKEELPNQDRPINKDTESENIALKKQLLESKQAITRLETILATQQGQQGGADDWGIVDLGEPHFSSMSMQTSLMEKDKTVTVIQEQLKEALEQVSSTSDENKLLQHKIRALEKELLQRDDAAQIENDHVHQLNMEIATLNQEIYTLQMTNNELQQQATETILPTTVTSEVPVSTLSASGLFTAPSSTVEDEPSCKVEPNEAEELKESSMHQLLYKISWYEENWVKWTDYCNQLQVNSEGFQKEVASLMQQLENYTGLEAKSHSEDEFIKLKNDLSELQSLYEMVMEEKKVLEINLEELKLERKGSVENSKRLEEANLEISKLRGFETQVYELQSHIQTLQHQCAALEAQVSASESDLSRLHEYEVLYGELQTCMQESETKREGSKSRVQELELMVQSAEFEISRLRLELQSLKTVAEATEGERQSLREEAKRNMQEKEYCEAETLKQQNEATSLRNQILEFQNLDQRNQNEINQLRSEVEVLEGENERLRSHYEVVESENNRLSNDVDFLTQTNQMLTAQKESLETEIQRLETSGQALSSERNHFRGEMQRLYEVATSAESEISRLKQEVDSLHLMQSENLEAQSSSRDLESSIHIQLPQSQSKELLLEDVDWETEGKIDDEHIQRSSSVERDMQEEIDRLKRKVIDLERERNELTDELQESKLKNGKMIRKLKIANSEHDNLLKEFEKMKNSHGGFSGLDEALENEYKAQVMKAESERDELKIRLDEIEKERTHLTEKLDVVEIENKKFVQSKEFHDASMRQLSATNKSLESQVATLEWKLSEAEENALIGRASDPEINTEVNHLKQSIIKLQSQISGLQIENVELKTSNEELRLKLEAIITENRNLQSILNTLKDAKVQLEKEITNYKSSFIELNTVHDNLKDSNKTTEEELTQLQHQQYTLKAAYDVLYDDYQLLQDERDSFKYDLGIVTGEKDKLQDEIQSLNNQLEALKEEEEDEVIKALQDEISDLRLQNSDLKDEITRLSETMKQIEEETERTKHTLGQNLELQDLLKMDLIAKSEEFEQLKSKLELKEREFKYVDAEIAASRLMNKQQQHLLAEIDPQMKAMRNEIRIATEENEQLKKQVQLNDSSLLRLAAQMGESVVSSDSKPLSVSADSELEAALMSLHLRDLRCQQLSLEIHKLLEERDSLQLKLSASLRQNQELIRELSQNQHLPASFMPPPSLAEKLAQLRDLNSTLEKKALEGKSGSASGLPPSLPTFASHTAPSTPTATRYTNYAITRESQGSPSTLMSWILGRSTPKELLHV